MTALSLATQAGSPSNEKEIETWPLNESVPPLRESGMRENASGGALIASALENESMRHWRLLDGPVYAKSLLGLASILG